MNKELVHQWLNFFPYTWLCAWDDDREKGRKWGGQEYTPEQFDALFDQLSKLNDDGYNPCFTPNGFKGSRQMKDCVSINAWFVDLDDGTQEEQIAKIKASPLPPHFVHKTGRGHHCYWIAKDGTTTNWNEIMWHRLVPYFGGDTKAKDYSRAMRIPTSIHRKDPKNPKQTELLWGREFLDIAETFETRPGYTEAEMLAAFERKTETVEFVPQKPISRGFWPQIAQIDNKTALQRLSGKPEVKGEVFTFRKNSNGTEQIWANGKGTSSWIELDGHIGSHDKGGPTFIQWLKWYGLPHSQVATVVKRYMADLIPKGTDESQLFEFLTWPELATFTLDSILSTDRTKMCKYHIEPLDECLGGIFPHDLVVGFGDTGAGKSEFGIHIAYKNAEAKRNVVMYELEMDDGEMMRRRMLARLNTGEFASISPVRLAMNNLSDTERDRLKMATSEEAKLNEYLRIFHGGALNFEGFMSSLAQIQKTPVDLIVLDHLHYFSLDDHSDSMASTLGKVMRTIRTFVKDWGIPIVTTAHVRKRDITKDLELSDIYSSSDIPKESTVAIAIKREEETTHLTIKKSRLTGESNKTFSIAFHRDKREYDMSAKPKIATPSLPYSLTPLPF